MMSRPAPKHAPRVPFALLLLGLLVGALATLLMLNTASAANELRQHDLAAQDASVAARVAQLRDEVAASQAPGNLARVASQLGMVPAGNPAFLEIGADGSARVLGSAAPATAPPIAPPVTPAVHSTAAHSTAHSTATASSTAKSSSAKSSSAAKSKTSSSAAKSTSGAKKSGSASKSGSATTPAPDPTSTLPGGIR